MGFYDGGGTMKIYGTVCRGAGRASAAFTEQRMQEVWEMTGWYPYPGTLNMQLSNPKPQMSKLVALLGLPQAETEADTPIGPLQWWPGRLEMPSGHQEVALLVRGVGTATSYLEFVTQVSMRFAENLKDGAQVCFIPIMLSS